MKGAMLESHLGSLSRAAVGDSKGYPGCWDLQTMTPSLRLYIVSFWPQTLERLVATV